MTKELNGVDIEGFNETCSLLRKEEKLGKAEFRVQNEWKSGGNNRVVVEGYYAAGQEQKRPKTFTFQADEPPPLLGKDAGANPVEYLLTALSSCMTTSIVYHAAAKDIKIRRLTSEFKGELDLRGFLGLSEKVPKGYKKIYANFKIDTDAPVEKIKEFYQFSPVYDMISKSVPIEVDITKI